MLLDSIDPQHYKQYEWPFVKTRVDRLLQSDTKCFTSVGRSMDGESKSLVQLNILQ